MKKHENIIHFLQEVRNRLNRALLYRTVQWSFLVTGIALLAVAGVFILFGRAVPTWVYFTGLLCSAIAVFAVWAVRRFDLDKAGRFADDFFQLHDGVVSYRKFESQGKEGGFYDLQANQVETCVEHTDNPENIPLGLSRRVCVIAVILMVTALSTGFIDESDAVKLRKSQQEETLSKTKQVNEELKKELKDVLSDLEEEQTDDPETRKQLNDLKKMLNDLKITDDQKKALSQYAKLERKLHKMLNSAQQRKDELLLERVGDSLKSIRDGREIGKKLSKKDYKAASEALKKLQQDPEKRKTNEEKKKFAKLKNISQQMASTASSSLPKSASNSNDSSLKEKQNCKSGNCSLQENPTGKKNASLSEQMMQLNQSVQSYKKSQCKNGCKNCNSQLGSLCSSLSKLGSKRSMQMKMMSLSKKLGQCQSFMSNKQSNSLSQCMGSKPGGKKAGFGSVDSRTDKATPDFDNGNTTSLNGLKGSGPSEVTVEEAGSGTGSASGATASRQVQYRKQAEAYIQRQDVPTEVKQGVKHYFENIHQIEN